MSYERLAYDDADTAVQMHDDAAACGTHLTLPRQRVDEVALAEGAPSLAYDDFPHQVEKPQIEVSEAAAHLASRLHLHLD
jgi:hypothetical protein